MTDQRIIERLRSAAGKMSAVELAQLLEQSIGRALSQFTLTSYFVRAFPNIPLQTLSEAGDWHRLVDGGMSDQDFNDLLASYLHHRTDES